MSDPPRDSVRMKTTTSRRTVRPVKLSSRVSGSRRKGIVTRDPARIDRSVWSHLRTLFGHVPDRWEQPDLFDGVSA
jgi:hypothetical protein